MEDLGPDERQCSVLQRLGRYHRNPSQGLAQSKIGHLLSYLAVIAASGIHVIGLRTCADIHEVILDIMTWYCRTSMCKKGPIKTLFQPSSIVVVRFRMSSSRIPVHQRDIQRIQPFTATHRRPHPLTDSNYPSKRQDDSYPTEDKCYKLHDQPICVEAAFAVALVTTSYQELGPRRNDNDITGQCEEGGQKERNCDKQEVEGVGL